MKKALSLLLVLVLALGMATVSFAATAKITGFDPATETLIDGLPVYDFSYVVPGESATYDILVPTMFIWDGTAPAAADFNKKHMTNSKVTLRFTVRAGSKALDSIDFVDTTGGVGIEIAAINPFVSVDELDFDYTVYFTFNGKRNSHGINFVGTLANDSIPVEADDDYVDLSEGRIANAQDYIKAVEVDLGNNIYINTKMFKDKDYYGYSTTEITDADDEMFTKYPSLVGVAALSTIGLNAATNTVELRDYDGDFYVYDKDMNYLGKGNEKLAYSTKYYISSEEIETEDDDTDEAPVDEEGVDNENDNPGTGK